MNHQELNIPSVCNVFSSRYLNIVSQTVGILLFSLSLSIILFNDTPKIHFVWNSWIKVTISAIQLAFSGPFLTVILHSLVLLLCISNENFDLSIIIN